MRGLRSAREPAASSLLIDGPLFAAPGSTPVDSNDGASSYAVHALSEHLFTPKRRRERALAPTTSSRTVEEVVLSREVAGGYDESAGYTHARPKPLKRDHTTLALPPVATSPALRRVGRTKRSMTSAKRAGAPHSAARAADAPLQSENAELRRRVAALEAALRAAQEHEEAQQRFAAQQHPPRADEELAPLDSMGLTPTPGPETMARESEIRAVEHARDVATLRLDEIDSLIGQLNGAFIDDDQLIAAWHQGATHINNAARRFLVQRRYRRARAALISWVGRRAAPFVKRGSAVVARLRVTHEATLPFVTKRARVYKHRCMQGWKQMHRAMQRVRGMADISWEAKLRVTIRAWHDVASGPGSRKQVADRYMSRKKQARKAILERSGDAPGEGGATERIVTNRELQYELEAGATRAIRAALAVNNMKRHLKAWFDVAVRPRKAAYLHYCKALMRRCKSAWRKWVAGRVAEAGAAATVRKQRRDQLKLIGMMRSTNVNKLALQTKADVVTEWRHYAHPRAVVRKRERIVARRCRKDCFNAWRVVAKRQHAVRALVVEEWRHAAHHRMFGPFRAWYVLTQNVLKERAIHQVIIDAYQRRRTRATKQHMFKHWEHMTTYGDVSSMKSRQEMIVQIEEQRTYIIALNSHITMLAETIDDLEVRLDEERALTDSHSKQRSDAQNKSLDYQHALKNVEEQYMIAQSRLDALTALHPGTANRIRGEEQKIIDEKESTKLQRDLIDANLGKSTPDMDKSLAPLVRSPDAFLPCILSRVILLSFPPIIHAHSQSSPHPWLSAIRSLPDGTTSYQDAKITCVRTRTLLMSVRMLHHPDRISTLLHSETATSFSSSPRALPPLRACAAHALTHRNFAYPSFPPFSPPCKNQARWRDKIQKKRDKRVNFRGPAGGGRAFTRRQHNPAAVERTDRSRSISRRGSKSSITSAGSRPGSASSARSATPEGEAATAGGSESAAPARAAVEGAAAAEVPAPSGTATVPTLVETVAEEEEDDPELEQLEQYAVRQVVSPSQPPSLFLSLSFSLFLPAYFHRPPHHPNAHHSSPQPLPRPCLLSFSLCGSATTTTTIAYHDGRTRIRTLAKAKISSGCALRPRLQCSASRRWTGRRRTRRSR